MTYLQLKVYGTKGYQRDRISDRLSRAIIYAVGQFFEPHSYHLDMSPTLVLPPKNHSVGLESETLFTSDLLT